MTTYPHDWARKAEKIAERQIDYLAGKYIDPEEALGEVPPLAEIIRNVLENPNG